jgi:hypothetical protein
MPPRLRTASKPHCYRGIASSCCIGRSLSSSLSRYDAGAKHPTTMPRAAPLLPPSLLTLLAAPSSLQLPSLAPRSHGVLAHTRLPRGPIQRHPLASSPEPTAYGQTPPRRLHARLLPLRHRCCTLVHARSTAALSRHLPLSLLEQACVASTQYIAIKGGHLCISSTPRAVSASGKPSPPHPPLFSAASSVPSHFSPPLSPYAGPGASLSFRAAFWTKKATPSPSSTAPVSNVPPTPAFLASSYGSQSCQASAPWAREACGIHLAEGWPLASRHELCHGTRSERAAPCARCARTQATSCDRPGRVGRACPSLFWHCGWTAAGQAHAVRVGRARFRSRSRLKIKNFFSIFHSVLN